MNQLQKTMVFVGVAVVALILAFEPWRSAAKSSLDDQQVTKLFPDFADPAMAQNLQIIKFDESLAQLRQFSIQKEDGEWVIPSHSNYPADAREHMAAAATSLMDLESLSMRSSSPGDFETYGVIDPDMKSLKVGSVGVGMRVTMKDAKDKVLADLIIGKEPKDQPELRFVRVAGHDQVYVVKLKTDKLSTKFEDWIEKDLLKLNAFDIRQLDLNDYSIEPELARDGATVLVRNQRSKMKLVYDDEKSKWNLADFIAYKKESPVSEKLKDDEELNTEKLNGLKSALDDLQIVDVQRKPKGLSQDLRATEDFVKDNEAAISLQRKGFYAMRNDNGGMEIYSTEGEVLCMMKDGVEYVLRFGNVAAGSGDDEPDEAADGNKNKAKNSQLNRYLFVSCVLHEDMIPKPQLEELPSDSAEDAKPADDKKPADAAKPADNAKAADDAKAVNAKDDAKPDAAPSDKASGDDKATSDKPDSAKPEASPPSQDATGKQAAAGDSPAGGKSVFRLTAADETAVEKPAAADAKPAAKPAASPPADAKPADAKPADAKPADDTTDAKPAATNAKPAEEAAGGKIRAKARDAKALAEKQASIEKENKRKTDEYNEKLKKSQEHAKELNDRFADWYYVISDEVYHKIHLSRADIVKKKDKADGKADGLGDFKLPQKGGLPGHDHDHDHKPETKGK